MEVWVVELGVGFEEEMVRAKGVLQHHRAKCVVVVWSGFLFAAQCGAGIARIRCGQIPAEVVQERVRGGLKLAGSVSGCGGGRGWVGLGRGGHCGAVLTEARRRAVLGMSTASQTKRRLHRCGGTLSANRFNTLHSHSIIFRLNDDITHTTCTRTWV